MSNPVISDFTTARRQRIQDFAVIAAIEDERYTTLMDAARTYVMIARPQQFADFKVKYRYFQRLLVKEIGRVAYDSIDYRLTWFDGQLADSLTLSGGLRSPQSLKRLYEDAIIYIDSRGQLYLKLQLTFRRLGKRHLGGALGQQIAAMLLR